MAFENTMQALTTFEFQAIEGKSEELLFFFKRILPETRSFAGNKGAEASRLSKNQFMIIAYWGHKDNLGEYLNWREQRGDYSMLLSFLTQAPTVITYEVLGGI